MARASVRLSVRPSVHKACKHDTDWTVWARTVKLGTLTTYDKRMNPIDFQGQGSKVKVTRYILMLNLVNTIQTEPLKLGQSNLIHILLMTRGQHLLIFKVRGLRSRSHATHCFLNLVNTIQTEPFQLRPSNLVHILLFIDFQGQGSKVKVQRYILMLNLVNTIHSEPLKLGPSNLVHILLMTRTTPIDFQGQGSKVTRYTLLFNLVNIIQTEPFQLGPSYLVHILLMIRGRHLLIFKVRSQRSRSHTKHCFLAL